MVNWYLLKTTYWFEFCFVGKTRAMARSFPYVSYLIYFHQIIGGYRLKQKQMPFRNIYPDLQQE